MTMDARKQRVLQAIVALASGIVAVVVAFIACTVILKKAYKEDV